MLCFVQTVLIQAVLCALSWGSPGVKELGHGSCLEIPGSEWQEKTEVGRGQQAPSQACGGEHLPWVWDTVCVGTWSTRKVTRVGWQSVL